MNEIPQCKHIHDNGQPCQAIPVKDTPYCYFHRKYYLPEALPGDKNYQVPLLESHASIEIALTHLYQAFLAKKIDMKEAQFGLQIIRLASKTIAAMEKAAKQELKEKKASEAKVGFAAPLWKPAPTVDNPVVTFSEAETSSAPTDIEPTVYSEEFLNNPIVKARIEANERRWEAAKAKEAAEAKRGVWDPYGCMPGGNGSK